MPTLIEHVRQHAGRCYRLAGLACPDWTDAQIRRALLEAEDAVSTALEDDPDAYAELVAEILYGIYGDKALDVLHAASGKKDVHESRLLEAWDPSHHPRGKNGRFIAKGSGEAIAAAKEAIGKALKGEHSAAGAAEIMNHLNLLTVKQLKEIHKEHGAKPPSGLRDDLVESIKSAIEYRGKEKAQAVPASPVQKMHGTVADSLRGVLGDKAEAAAKEIGLSLNKHTIKNALVKHGGLDPAEAMEKVPEVTKGILDHLDAQGIPRPDPSLYEVKKETTGPEAWKEEQEKWKVERRKKEQEARDFADKNYKKPPPPDQATSEEWVAIHTRKAMAEVEKDKKKLGELWEKKRAVENSYNTNPDYYDDMRDIQAELDKPANKRLLRKYKPAGWTGKGLPDVGTAFQVAHSAQQAAQYTWEQGNFNKYSAIGAKALADRLDTIKKAVENPEHEMPEHVAEEFLYEGWMPVKYRERAITKSQVEAHKDYMGKQQPYANGVLRKSLEHAAPQIEPLMKKAAAIPPEIAEARRGYEQAVERDEAARSAYWDFLTPYRQGSGNYTVPHDKAEEYDRLDKERGTAANERSRLNSLKIKAEREHGQRWLESLLPEKGNADAVIPHSDHLSDRGREELAKANAFLQKAVGASWGKMEAKHSPLTSGDRAYCSGNEITTRPGVNASTLIHEYGHLIEHENNSTLGTLSKAFAMSEVERHGEKMKHLGTAYEANEVGARDGFMDSYTGKFYGWDSSEVLSMGIQHLYDNPLEFYQQSPKHFEYTLAALHGLLT